jgi:hypothetical protein
LIVERHIITRCEFGRSTYPYLSKKFTDAGINLAKFDNSAIRIFKLVHPLFNTQMIGHHARPAQQESEEQSDIRKDGLEYNFSLLFLGNFVIEVIFGDNFFNFCH